MSQTHSNVSDLSNFWMPFTANRQFKQNPRILSSASGLYYTSHDGRDVLDGTSGLWCVNAGHGRREIAQAVERQLMTLDFAPTFQMGHPIAFDCAKKIAEIAPANLDRIFFTNSGSESVDTALKIAIAYHRARGEAQRTRFIGRERGYHGVGFGGMSVGGIGNNRRIFPLLPSVDHLPHTHGIKENLFSVGQPKHGAYLADDLERLLALHGADTIAAVIVEPLAGSTGVLVPPVGYLERLRELCTRYGILLIFDEVITGFGRLGTPFATDYFKVTPDIITTAKGLSNGVVPMGAVLVSRPVHDAVVQGPPAAIEFFHGYTYSANPVACAAAMAVLEIYEREKLFSAYNRIDQEWTEALHALRDVPHVVDIRNLGLIGAIELQSRADAPGARAYEAFVAAFEAGLLIRVTGDVIALSPPLTITPDAIGRLFATLRNVLMTIA